MPLKVAVIEDAFSFKNYKSDNRIEYLAAPYTSAEELSEALSNVSPDLVIVSENCQKAALFLDYPMLLAVENYDIYKLRSALAFNMKGIVTKPVTYEKVVRGLEGKPPRETGTDKNSVYFGEDYHGEQAPRMERPEIKIELPPVETVRELIKKPVIIRSEEEKGQAIVFLSSKGGTGKTFLSVNFAVYAAKMYPSKKIALIDFNLDFGGAAPLLGIEPKITAMSWQYIPEDSLSSTGVEGYLIKHSTGIYVLPAPIPPVNEDVFTYKTAHRILETLKKHFDLVIVDMGPALRDVTVVAIEHADKIYFVSTTGIPSLRNAVEMTRIFDGLKTNKEKIGLILNRLKNIIDDEELKSCVPYEIVLKVPYIKQAGELNDAGDLACENVRLKVYLHTLALKVFGKEPEKKGLFGFLKEA